VIVGFDPGGKGGFGWCILEDAVEPPLRVVDTGVSDSAEAAVKSLVVHNCDVQAAGIDAPLFWVPSGDRLADQHVRAEVKAQGAPSPGGTVQSVNSLRGACLVQGIMIAVLLRRRWPTLPITEAHPKAYLWTVGVATARIRASSVTLRSLRQFSCPAGTKHPNDHERDAAIAAYCAWAMVHRVAGWHDLLPKEKEAYLPIEHPLGYWYPPRGAVPCGDRLGSNPRFSGGPVADSKTRVAK
jgi:hypothetical protein